MAFSEILGQSSAITFLKRAIANDRLPSAYLFAGPHNIGKQKTVLALTQTINCLEKGDDACQQCPHCLQIAQNHFPDYLFIEPEGQFVKIGQIREALKWLELRPIQGKQRILAIGNAEQMNIEAANAFLKTLEEPPPQTLVILLAEHPQKLLETIVSRCQVVRFSLLAPPIVQQILSQKSDLSEEAIQFIMQFSLGRVQPDWIEQVEKLQELRQTIFEGLLTLSSASMETIANLCDVWGANKDKDGGRALDFLEFVFRDLAWLHNQCPSERLFNRDKEKELRLLYQRLEPSEIVKTYHTILQTREQIRMNARASLALLALWVRIKQKMVK